MNLNARNAFLMLLSAAVFSPPAAAADTQEWLRLKHQTIAHSSARQVQKEEASARALVKAAEELGPLPGNLRYMETSLLLLAGAFEAQKRPTDELATRLRLLELLEKYVGTESSDLCLPLTRLGDTYKKLGRLTEAEAAYERVLAIKEKADPEHLTGSLMKLGKHYDSVKKYSEAEATFKRLVLLYEKDGGDDNPNLKPVLGYLSAIHRKTGRDKEARAYALRAARIRD